MMLSILVVTPICIYILLGILVKKLKWIEQEGINQTNKILYKLFFPIIMFTNIYSSSLKESLNGRLIFYMLVTSTIVFILLNIFIPIFIKERPVQASMIQGIYRGNSILFAIPIISTIYGPENTGVAAVCVSVVVPFYNVFCVILLENKRGTKIKIKRLVFSVLKNPIIIGAIIGLLVKTLNITLPYVLEKVVMDLGEVLTPFALILLGAGLSFENIQKNKWYLTFVCIMKLIINPFIFVGLGYLLGFRGVELATIFALSCVPTAVSSYVMAKEMDADSQLAGEIVAFTTITSILTIFLWLLLLTGIGWI